MAPTKLVAHIPPDANPTNVTQLTTILIKERLVFSSVSDLMNYAEVQGVGGRTEIQSIATDLGLITKETNHKTATDLGKAFVRLREDVRADILHFLMYTGWSELKPIEFLSSWAYRDCCNRYWSLGEVSLTGNYLDRQVEETINYAREMYSNMGVGDFDEISFSRKSLSGARK